MKRILFALIVVPLLVASACKKNDNKGTSSNYWSVGNNTYATDSVTVSNNPTGSGSLMRGIYGTPGTNVINLFFGTSTITTGSYTIVGGVPGANEVEVQALDATALSGCTSTGNDHLSAVVSISAGKVKVVMPGIWAKVVGGTDSVQIAANLTQTN